MLYAPDVGNLQNGGSIEIYMDLALNDGEIVPARLLIALADVVTILKSVPTRANALYVTKNISGEDMQTMN